VNFESESSLKNEKNILLTKKGRELFGEEQNLFVEQESKSHKDIILSSSIIEKQLFYNDKEQKSIDYLTNLLQPDNYISVVNRMKDLGLKPGFTVLFHGSPGTGKTESVLQLARMTGRNIKKVDLSATKDKWYGSSERIVRSIFSTYSRENTNSERQSILLINEADGLLKKRQDGDSEISNLESTVVTILLDSFENFEGIMFCTANNTNFDKSFDRRFLYKILFQTPSPAVLSKIWKNRVPVLTEKQALYLAERFTFSGGQIDNVCKKIVMKQVLTGITPNLLEIEEFCQEESMDKPVGKRRIGYLI
jgi:SpoVK/Ycf46/Vps4 family AAA+-type ATPase